MSHVNSSADGNYDMHPAKSHNTENGRKERVETAFQCLSPEEVVQPLLRRQIKDPTTCSHLYITRKVHGIARFTLHKTAKGNGTSKTLMHV